MSFSFQVSGFRRQVTVSRAETFLPKNTMARKVESWQDLTAEQVERKPLGRTL